VVVDPGLQAPAVASVLAHCGARVTGLGSWRQNVLQHAEL
jgi:hypothetical protein